jgi:hypothetical protein
MTFGKWTHDERLTTWSVFYAFYVNAVLKTHNWRERSSGSSVNIVTRLPAGHSKNLSLILNRDKDFSLPLTWPASHPATYQRPTRFSIPVVNCPEREDGHWHPSSVDVTNTLGYTISILLTSSWRLSIRNNLFSRLKDRHSAVLPTQVESSGRSLWHPSGTNSFQIFIHHPFLSFVLFLSFCLSSF